MLTRIKSVSLALLLMGAVSKAQDVPHLVPRPAVVAPDHPDAPRSERHKWLRRVITIGSSSLAAKVADDSCDFIVGPTKARYVGAAAFATTFVIVHHYLHRGSKQK